MKVAVYGTLRNNGSNHRLLAGAELLATTKTAKNYDMFSLGAFPYIDLSKGDSKSQITVEVYEVSEEGLGTLDMLEGYPRFYSRSEVELENGMTAWIYHINGYKARQAPCVASGDWNNRVVGI